MSLFYDLRKDDPHQDSVTISDGRGMSACIMTYGATVQRLNVPDARGDVKDVILGYDSPAAYDLQDGYLGAIVGRVAGRIKDACYFVNGKKVELWPNQPYGVLHGGPVGFSYRTWEIVRKNSKNVHLRLVSADGDQGFPGTVTVDLLYSMEERGELTIRYHAVTDRDTPLNLTNHMYFNLDGQESGPVDGHRLMVNAKRYLVTDNDLVPTGAVDPLAGTLLDFNEMKAVGPVIRSPELDVTKGLDHSYVFNSSAADSEEPLAVLQAANSGIRMSVFTDRPCVQVYSAGCLGGRVGKNGAVYAPFHGICLETQGFPDALHHMNFPSVMLKAGESFDSFTAYRFSLDTEE